MELFGYVCSPLCKGKAQSHGIDIPVYAGQKSVVEARAWRKTARISATVGGLVAAVLGVWFWYAWFGSVPKTVWFVRFPERSYSGQSAFCGKDQIVFLHGDILARHDTKLKQEIWSRHLVDPKQIEAAIAKEMKEMQAIINKANSDGPDHVPKMPDPEKLQKNMQRAAEASLELVIRGQNIWVLSPGKLTRYDRDTGNPVKEIPVPAGYGGLIPRGDELLNVDLETGKPMVTHIDLTTCESRTEEIARPAPPRTLTRASPLRAREAGRPRRRREQGRRREGRAADRHARQRRRQSHGRKEGGGAGAAFVLPCQDCPAGDPGSQHEPGTHPGRDGRPPAGQGSSDGSRIDLREDVSLIPTKDGFLQFSVKLIEARITTRAAMKAAPAKSVLDGNLTVSETAEWPTRCLTMRSARGAARWSGRMRAATRPRSAGWIRPTPGAAK